MKKLIKVQVLRPPRVTQYRAVYDKATGKVAGVELVTEPVGAGANGNGADHGA